MRKNNLFDNLTPLGLVFLAACKGTTSSSMAAFNGKVEDGEPFERTLLDGNYSLTPTQEDDYYSQAISLPLHVGLADAEQSYIIKTLRDSLR